MVDSVLLELVDFLMQEFTASSGVVVFFFSDMESSPSFYCNRLSNLFYVNRYRFGRVFCFFFSLLKTLLYPIFFRYIFVLGARYINLHSIGLRIFSSY